MELKKANPGLPILIRECSDVQPKLWARYGKPGKRAIWEPGRRIGVGEDEGPSRVTEKPVGRLELGTWALLLTLFQINLHSRCSRMLILE